MFKHLYSWLLIDLEDIFVHGKDSKVMNRTCLKRKKHNRRKWSCFSVVSNVNFEWISCSGFSVCCSLKCISYFYRYNCKSKKNNNKKKQMSNLEFSSSVFIANFEVFGQRLVKFTNRCPSISKLALKTLELNSRLLFCFVVAVVVVFCLCNCTYKNKKYI